MAGEDGASSIQACAMRLSRLAADGTTPAGATNAIVTNSIIKVQLKQNFEAGTAFTGVNGCGAVAIAYQDVDHLKGITATLDITTPDAEAAEMLTGGSLITAGGQTIGFSVPAVGAAASTGVCLEVWSKAWIGNGAPPGVTYTDGATATSTTLTSASAAFTSADVGRTISGAGIPANTTIASVTNGTTVILSAAATATATGVTITIGRPGGYWRHVFPKFLAVLSDFNLENALKAVTFTGPMYENPGIGNGPANDFPASMVSSRLYSYYRDSALPTIGIGYMTTPAQV